MGHIAAHVQQSGGGGLAAAYDRKAAKASERAELVRRAVMGHGNLSGEDLLGES